MANEPGRNNPMTRANPLDPPDVLECPKLSHGRVERLAQTAAARAGKVDRGGVLEIASGIF